MKLHCRKLEEPCTPWKKEIYDSIWEFSLEGKHRKKAGGGGGGKLGSTFGQSQAKEPLHKGGGEDT